MSPDPVPYADFLCALAAGFFAAASFDAFFPAIGIRSLSVRRRLAGLLALFLRRLGRMPRTKALTVRMTEQGLIIRFDRPVAFADRFLHGLNIDDLNSTS